MSKASDASASVALEGYPGLCALCGADAFFPRGEQRSVREAYACPSCRASLRYRDQAACIVDEFGAGVARDLKALVASGRMDGLAIYEPAYHGPFVRCLSQLPGYGRSYYWDDGVRGEMMNGLPFEDLCNLSFASGTFDLVLTSDVMEHVVDPFRAFAEIGRVLKIGGVHIFSIPTRWPLDAKSQDRIRLSDGRIEHLVSPRYHRGGDGSDSLVITDFGSDLVDRLSAFGLRLQIIRRTPVDPPSQNATFVARRLS